MAECLIALGSNLGDRAATLRQAVEAIGRAPCTQIVVRSAWRETPPIGGPTGQGAFLNGAVRIATGLDSRALFAELVRIETQMGRTRTQAWGPRTVDLDLLLYNAEVRNAEIRGDEKHGARDALTLPHPRMHYRRFVLEPAAEAAPSMIHPTSGWTVARLLDQLNASANDVAIAAADATLANDLAAQLNKQKKVTGTFSMRPWTGGAWNPGPNLLLAVGPPTGVSADECRKMLKLPPSGPIVWLNPGTTDALLEEASTVLTSANADNLIHSEFSADVADHRR